MCEGDEPMNEKIFTSLRWSLIPSAAALFLVPSALPATQMGENQPVVLENANLHLTFGSIDGQLKSFIVRKSADNYLKGLTESVPAFSVIVGNPNGTAQVEAYPGPLSVSKSGDTLTILAGSLETGGNKIPIRTEVRVQLAPDAVETRWSVHLSNQDQNRCVFGVSLPRIYGVRLGDRWEDDSLYFPYGGGERFRSAVADFAALGERKLPPLEMGNPRVAKNNGRYVHDLSYAAGASMMWMDYADSAHGLYIASYDPDFLVTVLRADTRGPSAGAMNFEFRKWVTVRPGQTWSSAPTIVAAHGGDWHWAADRYRAWFITRMPLTLHGGAWRESVGGWLSFIKNAQGRVKFRFADLPQLWDRTQKAGMDLLIPYGWSTGGFDTFNPEFYPDLELGGPMAMSRAQMEIRRAGGHVMNYLNARIFNMRSVYFKNLGAEWAVKNPDGSYVEEKYEPGSPESFVAVCPGIPGWRNLLADMGEMLVRHYHADLVYYDQIAAARPLACYSTSHDHEQIGLWNQRYLALLRQANEAIRKVNPDAALMIEGTADLYTPYVLFQSYIGPAFAGTRFNFPELYKYTFPEAIQASLLMHTRDLPDPMYPGFPGVPYDVASTWLCREILVGNLFAYLDQILEDHPWWEEAQQLVALKKAAAPWMAQGVFRDNVDVANAEASLEVKTFRLDQGERRTTLIGVFNADRKAARRITIQCGPLTSVRGFRLGPNGTRSATPVTFRGGRASFEVPSNLLSMTVIEGLRR